MIKCFIWIRYTTDEQVLNRSAGVLDYQLQIKKNIVAETISQLISQKSIATIGVKQTFPPQMWVFAFFYDRKLIIWGIFDCWSDKMNFTFGKLVISSLKFDIL